MALGGELYCEKCGTEYSLNKPLKRQQEYVLSTVRARSYKTLKCINLDDEYIPVAKSREKTRDGLYFVEVVITESERHGTQLVVYAGRRGRSSKKTQIFIDPAVKRLTFDPKDLHPSDVFLKLEATFDDRSTHLVKKH